MKAREKQFGPLYVSRASSGPSLARAGCGLSLEGRLVEARKIDIDVSWADNVYTIQNL